MADGDRRHPAGGRSAGGRGGAPAAWVTTSLRRPPGAQPDSAAARGLQPTTCRDRRPDPPVVRPGGVSPRTDDPVRVDFSLLGSATGRPTDVGELRASLAVANLIAATVLRRAVLDDESARLLGVVITELEGDIDFLWEEHEGDPPDGGRLIAADQTLRLRQLAGRVCSCADLLLDAVDFLTIAPEHARRLDLVVAELDETVRMIWQSVVPTDEPPAA